MKKAISFILVIILLILPVYVLAETDFSTMSDEELEQLIQEAQAELDRRKASASVSESEKIDFLPIERYRNTNIIIKNIKTGKSFAWACPIEEAIEASSALLKSNDGTDASKPDTWENGSIVIHASSGKIPTERNVDEISIVSDEWIVNNFLMIGLSKEEVITRMGNDYQFHLYTTPNPYYSFTYILHNCRIVISFADDTVQQIFIDEKMFWSHVQNPLYVANGHFSIYELYPTKSSDLVRCCCEFRNTSGRIIKYLTITATPYNAVDDIVYSSINNESKKSFLFTGPIEVNKTEYLRSEDGWYNSNIRYVKLEEIKITYLDGEQETLYFAPNW